MKATKDAVGRVKRQGARFRVYGFGAQGTVAELTADHPAVERITWTVTLANKKAEWFRCSGAKQYAAIWQGGDGRRRNAAVTGKDRDGLNIGPSSVSIASVDQKSGELTGTSTLPGFDPKPVYLGELRTDPSGRLIVLGGCGESASLPKDNPLAHYANNDGWHDDASDGPVVAEVRLKDGTLLEVRGTAWVVVVPPHFSRTPRTSSACTQASFWRRLLNTARWKPAELGAKPNVEDVPSFEMDILPILSRLTRYQWVSRRAHRGHSRGRGGDFVDPEVLRILASPEEARKPESLHGKIFNRIRKPLKHPLSAGLGTGYRSIRRVRRLSIKRTFLSCRLWPAIRRRPLVRRVSAGRRRWCYIPRRKRGSPSPSFSIKGCVAGRTVTFRAPERSPLQ